MVQSGEQVSSFATRSADSDAVEEPLVIDGFPVDDEKLPALKELSGDLQGIAEIIGVRQVMRIALRFSGCRVLFPSFKQYRARLRHERIRTDYDAGMSVKSLSQKYDLSERHIWAILGS